MIAERGNETVKSERTSSLITVARARVWASEGWQVTITSGGDANCLWTDAPEQFGWPTDPLTSRTRIPGQDFSSSVMPLDA